MHVNMHAYACKNKFMTWNQDGELNKYSKICWPHEEYILSSLLLLGKMKTISKQKFQQVQWAH